MNNNQSKTGASKKKVNWLPMMLPILISFLILINLFSVYKTFAVPQKWEYKVVRNTELNINETSSDNVKINEKELLLLGQEGWELIGVYPEIGVDSQKDASLIFKRPK